MRVTPLPSALSIATAAVTFTAAVLAPATPSSALAERWLRPTPGEVTRAFSYSQAAPFKRGAHRGVDFAAPPGTVARAACDGRVAHAGPVAGHGGVVSLRCGSRRVTHLPLASIRVRAGGRVRAGAPLGTVAPGHGGLHLGVRRERDPFGYEDPLAILGSPSRPFMTPPPVPLPRGGSRHPAPVHAWPRRPSPHPWPSRPPALRPSPSRPPALRPSPSRPPTAGPIAPPSAARPAQPTAAPVAPPPVWVGLALLLLGAAGSGTVAIRRRLRVHRAVRRKEVAASL